MAERKKADVPQVERGAARCMNPRKQQKSEKSSCDSARRDQATQVPHMREWPPGAEHRGLVGAGERRE